jgi:hypothetical protein
VKILIGKTITLKMDSLDTIKNVKAKIQDNEGTLIIVGKELKNGCILVNYKFQKELIPHLVLHLYRGSKNKGMTTSSIVPKVFI